MASGKQTQDDPRTAAEVKFDATLTMVQECAAEVAKLAQIVHESNSRAGNTTTVIHKTEGMGTWGAAAVVACFSTLVLMILFAIVIEPDLHDLKAWQDIMRKDIARLQAEKHP